MGKTYIIGVAGGTASGKTTIVEKIKKVFQNDIEVLNHDCYYLAHNDMPLEERKKLNYDHPNSFDTERFIKDIKELKSGKIIQRPVYDYCIHNRSSETVTVCPKRVIIVEGILVLENPKLRDLMDIKIFVDTDADIRLMRRISRDMKERNRSLDSIISQYSETVKPMHEQFVEPTKKYADIIIPRGGHNKPAISLMIQHIKNVIENDTNQ
ncbi:uridine kinase [Histomonas meleagridis]|uniref:uridine kinase n=1 Tax=Histomonas meleagridis TaxID=135588 RepID=UPI00355A8C3B|nr:uridine kinase [Histomonas meleagridis]KAH0797278.1 uridine kinase [Histomonas meleagridis]